MSDRSKELDERIVRELRADPRQSNVALGRKVDLSEGAVRRRIDNLLATGSIRFTVDVDPAFLGLSSHALTRLRCAPHLIGEVMEALSQMPELDTVYLCTGQFDITAVGRFTSNLELREFVTTRLGSIPGIVEMQSELVLETVHPPDRAPDDAAGQEDS